MRFRERKKAFLNANYSNVLPPNKNATILDIGPGFGELIELLGVNLGYKQVSAIDLSAEVVEFCNQCLPNSTTKVDDSSEFLRQNPRMFDRIFMLHVLEHLPKLEVIPLLQKVKESLKPDGKLIIEVPNLANPFTGPYIRYADFTHEIGFTELSLAYVLNQAGFSNIVLREFLPANDHPLRPLQRLVQKAFKLMLKLAYRAYAAHSPSILSPALIAIAAK